MFKVSVIIPVFNAEKHIKVCLDALLRQTLKDIEIICVDDGSSDNSLNILKEYAQKDNRIKVISQENKGQGVARNEGMNIAQGKYISFCDQDDFFDDDYVEKLYTRAIDKNLDICFCPMRYTFLNSWENLGYVFDYSEKLNIFEFILLRQIEPWCKIYKKSFLDKHNIKFGTIRCGEDISFAFECLLNKPLIDVECKTKYNRLLLSSSCSKSSISFIELNIFVDILINLDKYNLSDEDMVFWKKLILDRLIKSFKFIFSKLLAKINFDYGFSFSRKEAVIIKIPLPQQIFSVKNDRNHKVLRFLGFKFKFRRKMKNKN